MSLTAQQHEQRALGIGGSDIATILGLNPYKTRYELWLEKTGQLQPTAANEDQIDQGHILEGPIAELYVRRKQREGVEVRLRKRKQTIVHKDYPWLRANIDREIVGQRKGLEIKKVNWRSGFDWGEDGDIHGVPESYQPQVYHYLTVLGYEEWDLAAYIGGSELKVFEFEADEEWSQIIIEAAGDFWENHVLPEVAPEMEYNHRRTTDLLKRLYPGTNGETVDLESDLLYWHRVLQQANEQAKLYHNVATGARNHIMHSLGEAAIGILSNGECYTRKEIQRRGYTVEPTSYLDLRHRKKAPRSL